MIFLLVVLFLAAWNSVWQIYGWSDTGHWFVERRCDGSTRDATAIALFCGVLWGNTVYLLWVARAWAQYLLFSPPKDDEDG